jgi:F0F1-type ATP synthase assembly protein I
MGLELAAAIVGLTLVGLWVDHQFGTGRKGVMIGATLGVIGGFYNFLRQALLLARQNSDTKKDNDADQGDDTTPAS